MSEDPENRPGYLAEVSWLDIASAAGWSEGWDPDVEPARCVDVGWVTHRDGFIVLVRSICVSGGFVGDVAAIPDGVVESIVRLEYSDPKLRGG